MVRDVIWKTDITIEAVNQVPMKMTRSAGYSLVVMASISSFFNIISLIMTVFITEIKHFPRTAMIPETPLVMKKLTAFFKARVKATMAEVQKLSPVKAT